MFSQQSLPRNLPPYVNHTRTTRSRTRAQASVSTPITRPFSRIGRAHVGRNLNIVIRTRARNREAIGMRRPERRGVTTDVFRWASPERAYGWTITGAKLRKTRGTWASTTLICAHDPGHFRSHCPLKKSSGRGHRVLPFVTCNVALGKLYRPRAGLHGIVRTLYLVMTNEQKCIIERSKIVS